MLLELLALFKQIDCSGLFRRNIHVLGSSDDLSTALLVSVYKGYTRAKTFKENLGKSKQR